ncbi:MAG TPA: hypothetical protein VI248_15815 [Kineosporiaceae bacterium]
MPRERLHLPHFRPEFTPSAGVELLSEYLLPRDVAADAVRALQVGGGTLGPVLHTSRRSCAGSTRAGRSATASSTTSSPAARPADGAGERYWAS